MRKAVAGGGGLILLALGIWAAKSPAEASATEHSAMSMESVPFGTTAQGEAVQLYTLRNANGIIAKVMTYGAIIYSLEVPDKNGRLTNVNANCASLADYENKSPCFGAVIGRYANRIAHAGFTLEGRRISVARNAGPHHIHGGVRGFHKRVWKGDPTRGSDFVGLTLTYLSKDGEEGYPGNLTCTVRYELNNKNEWKMEYTARTDKTTVVNLSNHSYWNLAGAESGTVLDQELTVNADKYLLADDALIPTGAIASVEGTPVDFRTPHRIGERMDEIKEKQFGGGYDHCLVVNHKVPGDLMFCAKLKDPQSGRTMEVRTTQPGVQIFTANFDSGAFHGPGGYAYPRHLGLCLETQHFPDSPNKPQFPSTTLKPGETLHEVTIHKFGVEP
ncbi:MAG TPA: aldose epimerase family protein [Patescibacteria group bacterium]|nr:aldose epimerase family protein [Patescibacteria group bacterium]